MECIKNDQWITDSSVEKLTVSQLTTARAAMMYNKRNKTDKKSLRLLIARKSVFKGIYYQLSTNQEKKQSVFPKKKKKNCFHFL